MNQSEIFAAMSARMMRRIELEMLRPNTGFFQSTVPQRRGMSSQDYPQRYVPPYSRAYQSDSAAWGVPSILLCSV